MGSGVARRGIPTSCRYVRMDVSAKLRRRNSSSMSRRLWFTESPPSPRIKIPRQPQMSVHRHANASAIAAASFKAASIMDSVGCVRSDCVAHDPSYWPVVSTNALTDGRMSPHIGLHPEILPNTSLSVALQLSQGRPCAVTHTFPYRFFGRFGD